MADIGTSAHETVRPTRWRDIVITFAGALLIVAACNLLVAPRLLRKAPNLAGWVIGFKWRLLFDLGKPADWLILGDSSCNQGVDPDLFGEKVGGDAVNLCTIGDMLAVNDAWMLDWHIRHYGPPKSVLLVHVYDIWNRSFEPARMGSMPLGYREVKALQPRVRLPRADLRRYLETRYFPLYANNLSLAAMLRLGDPGQPHAGATRQVNAKGFLAAHGAAPDSVRQDMAGHLRWLEHRQFKLSRDNAGALEHIIALAQQYNFDVYLATSPMVDQLAGDPRFREYYGALETALRGFEARSGGRLHLLVDSIMTYPAEEMQNADHLVASAARDYTLRLAAEIAAKQKSSSAAIYRDSSAATAPRQER